MDRLELSLSTAAENLALEEALLAEAEQQEQPRELLRLWESPELAVVLGRSSKSALEVHQHFCQQQEISILRRTSGGASVVIGPGCLMYTVILSLVEQPQLGVINNAHQYVLGRVVRALQPICPEVSHQGISDITLGTHKVSGNSLQIKRKVLIYHGTLLYDFPLDVLPKCLDFAPRQPEYRSGRGHRDFVANLPLSQSQIRDALIESWEATSIRQTWPKDQVEKLVAEKYSQDEWNLQR